MPRNPLRPLPPRRFLPQRLVSCAILTALLTAPACFATTPPDGLAEYRQKYERESDPVRKAKALTKLGDAQVLEFVHQAAADNYTAAFATLTEYRNEVRTTFDMLKATGNDAERKPEGFKQLQIHLRKSLWEIGRITPRIPGDRHGTFDDIHNELGRIQNELIHMLFPREPGGGKSG